jgi:hypothetical protein
MCTRSEQLASCEYRSGVHLLAYFYELDHEESFIRYVSFSIDMASLT